MSLNETTFFPNHFALLFYEYILLLLISKYTENLKLHEKGKESNFFVLDLSTGDICKIFMAVSK